MLGSTTAFQNVTGRAAQATFTNPIKSTDGSDPFMVYIGPYYYLTTTTWTNVQITRATTIEGLKTGEVMTAYTSTVSSRCCNVWAPEIHYVNGRWYIYFVAGQSGNTNNQFIQVLEGPTDIPWGSYTYIATINIPNHNVWSIDPTILVLPSGQYLVYSSFQGSLQSLWIAYMTSPTTVGNAVLISEPTLSWETETAPVNEGPVALYHGGRTWLFYSASACWGNYKLGRLELTGSNPLSASSWTKHPDPVFVAANGYVIIFTPPGHNYFFIAPNGVDIWNVFHASPTSNVLCDGSRKTFVQPVTWNSDGTPSLGSPIAPGVAQNEPT
ncbi:glycoside hydrolase family 43 protein [Vararia minispora EC-137]|uniref:Glycoside hydrolase family 43 protein n=1 Tax=Vararia minispora EC-137 TaxID=1314806 RepID=A0ACB8QBC5_9AGAM|nr:glycoside hydrolase family 43 protein [Vararia minispora EC-137]